MKITAIRVENILGIKDIDVAVKHPVALFCGDNDVGKTSLQEAIRLAFTGEAFRIKLKKDYKNLVRMGAERGSAVVEFAVGDRAGRGSFYTSGNKHDCSPKPPPQLQFILDAGRFTGLNDVERRRFLSDLFHVRANLDAVGERMVKKGCLPDLVKIILPVLRTGFENGEKYANDQLSHWRANWAAITGEVYGAVKAETWTAPLTATEVNKEELANIAANILEFTEEARDLQKKIGAGEAYLRRKDEYEKEAVSLREKSANLATITRDVQAAEKNIPKIRAAAEKARAKLDAARRKGQPCPSCGSMLCVTEAGKIEEVQVAKPADIANLEAAVAHEESALRTLEQTVVSLKADFNAALSASQTLAALEQAMGTPMTPEKLNELKLGEAALRDDIAALEKRKAEIQSAADQAEKARKQTADARMAHLKFKGWSTVRDCVAPTGIPGELLEETLAPMNERLKATAKITGWPAAQVRGDMEIVVKDLPYALQSESVRWRVDAMVAEAISFAAGLKVLILDRIDVLSPQNRGSLIDWCFHLAEQDGYESILLFGTLKAKPDIEGASVFWITGGRA